MTSFRTALVAFADMNHMVSREIAQHVELAKQKHMIAEAEQLLAQRVDYLLLGMKKQPLDTRLWNDIFEEKRKRPLDDDKKQQQQEPASKKQKVADHDDDNFEFLVAATTNTAAKNINFVDDEDEEEL